MKLYNLINRLDSIVPEETQESWDNSGIQISEELLWRWK